MKISWEIWHAIKELLTKAGIDLAIN